MGRRSRAADLATSDRRLLRAYRDIYRPGADPAYDGDHLRPDWRHVAIREVAAYASTELGIQRDHRGWLVYDPDGRPLATVTQDDPLSPGQLAWLWVDWFHHRYPPEAPMVATITIDRRGETRRCCISVDGIVLLAELAAAEAKRAAWEAQDATHRAIAGAEDQWTIAHAHMARARELAGIARQLRELTDGVVATEPAGESA